MNPRGAKHISKLIQNKKMITANINNDVVRMKNNTPCYLSLFSILISHSIIISLPPLETQGSSMLSLFNESPACAPSSGAVVRLSPVVGGVGRRGSTGPDSQGLHSKRPAFRNIISIKQARTRQQMTTAPRTASDSPDLHQVSNSNRLNNLTHLITLVLPGFVFVLCPIKKNSNWH